MKYAKGNRLVWGSLRNSRKTALVRLCARVAGKGIFRHSPLACAGSHFKAVWVIVQPPGKLAGEGV
jgi:hypothetical protein